MGRRVMDTVGPVPAAPFLSVSTLAPPSNPRAAGTLESLSVHPPASGQMHSQPPPVIMAANTLSTALGALCVLPHSVL